MIRIVDYGMGNLRSVQKAFEHNGTPADFATTPEQVRAASKVVLPGVGAFRDAAAELRKDGLQEAILEHISAGKPFLGVCLGLQLLFETSFEDGEHQGMGVVSGDVVRFDEAHALKIPHMGWNTLSRRRDSPLLTGIAPDAHFYFVHSYYVRPEQRDVIAAETEHGVEFVSMIQTDNLFATQFHPEKSQRPGLRLLANFAAI